MDDYNAGYMPTSMPTSLLPSNNNSDTNVNTLSHKGTRAEYGDVETHALLFLEAGIWPSNPPMPPPHPSSYMQQQQPWNELV
ncbi:hypothetical protein FOVG_19054 [Fusarium oxysporum f. sp. pisi HDV247]|uniref:Uncharacterized protein n=1 Tax=Fusarium oxysporum f. sp. pisi HDV247 TaxID=1080344 RepID=W9NNP8_FUSOX|nr:hypothetical protein FOVG_19054 [Fusarium oxysporum f. sp. pisi HDV247]